MRATRVLMIVALVGLAAPSAQASPYSHNVLHDDPIGYWRLDETSFGGAGDAADATGNAHDGTYTNTTAVTLAQADPSSNYGFRLRIGDNYVGAAFDHDGSLAPQLIIRHVPEPATLSLLALGAGLLARRWRRRSS